MAEKKKKIKAVDSLAVRTRPKTLADIVGNELVISTFVGCFKERKFSKAWFLAGPTGCGKTTTARILARTLNCQKLSKKGILCGKCKSCKEVLDSHPDIIEMNAAYATGIDDTRNLIKQASFSPLHNFKIFIIDEAHQLSKQAMQALLKPIEEPPPNTIWIFCTSVPEKFAKEVLGRFNKQYFHYPTVEEMSKHLKKISKDEYDKEIRKIVKPYYKLIADGCGCQPRESLNSLERVCSIIKAKENLSKKKIKQVINEIVAEASEVDLTAMDFLNACYTSSVEEALTLINKVNKTDLDNFLNTIHRYSHYAAVWCMGDKPNTRNFWGIRFKHWNKMLKDSKISNAMIPLSVCQAVTLTTEKSRSGSIDAMQILVSLAYKALANVNDSRKIKRNLED